MRNSRQREHCSSGRLFLLLLTCSIFSQHLQLTTFVFAHSTPSHATVVTVTPDTTTTTNSVDNNILTMTTTTSAWGAGLSQTDLMERDTVLTCDHQDRLLGSATKKDSHVFSKQQPHGILHRAFSVFLFDESTGKLLLHQRAADKITFPNVWTNTCCSHPLHGMTPSEVDSPQDIADGTVMGVKHAAARKLQHELGIPPEQIQLSHMKFLTRLHYWAADTQTHGTNAPWGEHEIDYVLFWTVPNAQAVVSLQPNPEEIQAVRWVSSEELQEMLNDTDKHLFSPWFRLIYQKWLKHLWWKDLKTTMNTQKYVDTKTIHTFDPPPEHFGGAGQAQALFATTETTSYDESKKQGAYGKVKIHSESKLTQLSHIDEVMAALTLLYIKPLRSNLSSDYVRDKFNADDLAFCDDILVKVSRSFAAVIRQLPGTMLVDVLVFYLVLRALDTIEDDTTVFASHREKIQCLRNFYENALVDPNWTLDGVGEGDERRLLVEFPKCHRIFQQLSPASQEIIQDINKRMAVGMSEFVDKDMGQGTTDVEQYNRYCHFVAGLVGEGLSRLFAASGLESESFAKENELSNQMGLFLQKTNIIRDYLEDYVDKRAWWPQTVWKKYSDTGDLGYFAQSPSDPIAAVKSLQCLNELVTDALELVPDCLVYLSKLQCAEIFRFCAIPQVMAIATLDKCYANPDLFTGVVKIRKGTSCKLILRTNTVAQVHETFFNYATSIKNKLLKGKESGFIDPSFDRTLAICNKICDLTRTQAMMQSRKRSRRWVTCAAILAAAGVVDKSWAQPLLVAAASAVYLFGPWDVESNLLQAKALGGKR